MSNDSLRYDRMVEVALRGVVKEALKEAESGLPGDHHFYITFRTNYPEVELPPQVKAQYPEEITIVLQHQFYDLRVVDDALGVTLSFGGRLERIRVPLTSITAFADPSVNFGLQFQAPVVEHAEKPAAPSQSEEEPAAKSEPAETPKRGEVVALDAFRKR